MLVVYIIQETGREETKTKMQCALRGEVMDTMDMSYLDHECAPQGTSGIPNNLSFQQFLATKTALLIFIGTGYI